MVLIYTIMGAESLSAPRAAGMVQSQPEAFLLCCFAVPGLCHGLLLPLLPAGRGCGSCWGFPWVGTVSSSVEGLCWQKTHLMEHRSGWIPSHSVLSLMKLDRKAQQRQLGLLLISCLSPGLVFPLSNVSCQLCCVHPSLFCWASPTREKRGYNWGGSHQQPIHLAACHEHAAICCVIYKAMHPFLRAALNLSISKSRRIDCCCHL